jgi:bifunctional DNA-binding transcriptional regulator/antitoxin component of YhaV-PrlF toxin-antitoxin module
MGNDLHRTDLVYKRKLAEDGRGHYRLSIPAVLAEFLGLSQGGDLAIVVDTDNRELILRSPSEVQREG